MEENIYDAKIAIWKIADLKLSEYNPRTISKSRLEDLKQSLRHDPRFFGARRVLVNVNPDRYGIVIGGHMRVIAAKELGWTEVPVTEMHANDIAEEKRWNLKDNAHHGENDMDAMAGIIFDDPIALDGALPGDIYDKILNDYGPDSEPESEETQIDNIASASETIVKLGDVWQLGEHVLVCGDSTDPKTFDLLLGGETADMTWTDPPYNVGYKSRGKDLVDSGAESIENDKMDDASWAVFVRGWMRNIHAQTKGAAYICMSTKEWPALHSAFLEAGFHWSDTIIWIKDRFVLGWSDYRRQHEPIMVGRKMRSADSEPILYGWPNGANHKWNGGRDESDAWFFKRPGKNPVHPTQKPVELVAKAIANSSDRGDTVLDPFTGGGSTLIACERMKRKARCIELSPGFCDAIIARYVGHTKNKHLNRNGEPHEWVGPVITIEGVLDSLA